MTNTTMTCEQFNEQLADYLEGSLDRRARAEMDAHLATCERCSALLADLDSIRVEAKALPVLTPSRDLWDGIAARIAAPVVAIETLRSGEHAAAVAPLSVVPSAPDRARRVWFADPRWLAAAGILLVATTAAVTTVITTHGHGGRGPVMLQQPPAMTASANTPAPSSTVPAVLPSPTPDTNSTAPRTARPTAPTRFVSAPESAPRAAAAVTAVSTGARTYDHEISQLRRLVTANSAQMDPKTRAVLEHNLTIIDDAIAQSRAALAHDPNSDYLVRQLDSALEQKVDLLRTAAFLPRS